MTTSHLRAVSNNVPGSIEVRDAEIIVSDLVIENAELAKYLANFNTSQQQLIAFVDLLNFAVYVKGLAGSTLETENVKKSAEMLVQSLNGTVATVTQTIESETNKLIHPETGVIAQKLREAAGSINDENEAVLKALLSPADPASPIGQLKTNIATSLNTHVDGLKTDISKVLELVNQFIGSQKTKKELYVKSREKGGDLEEILDAMIQREATAHGDDARYTGDTAAPSGKNVGDEVVTLKLDDTGNKVINIVWEAKTDNTFKDAKNRLKMDKVARELNEAISNREAVCGIFVSDALGLNLDVQPVWKEFEGNKLVIVLDPEDPDERLVRMAYLWARSYALRAIAPEDAEYDVEAIERVINSLEREFNTLRQLKAAHTPIKENIEKAQRFVDDFEENINKMLSELHKLVTPSD